MGRRAHWSRQRLSAVLAHRRSRIPIHRGHRCRYSDRWISGAIVIASNLIELRQARSLSRPQLARSAKVSRSHLWAIETGKIVPGISTLVKISEALGVGLSRFLTKSNTGLLLEHSFVRSIRGFLPRLNLEHRQLILKTLQAAPQTLSSNVGLKRCGANAQRTKP